MRELERLPSPPPPALDIAASRVAIVGAGRLGSLLTAALRERGVTVVGPLRRGEPAPATVEVVLLCVPDSEIASAAADVPAGPRIGHCSGASSLGPLGDRSAFSLHPLMTIVAGARPAVLRGAAAAIDGSDPAALAQAHALAEALGLRPRRITGEDRAAYHAAASFAANFLVTVEAAAERLGASAGLERAQLVPLVRAAVENWASLGGRAALTGPVARGDAATVARQRAAVQGRTPDLLELFDALAAATRRLAGEPEAVPC
jgi:predicted short-subunit dehydrogenase-like oxidoreductase (DUF2520 family)